MNEINTVPKTIYAKIGIYLFGVIYLLLFLFLLFSLLISPGIESDVGKNVFVFYPWVLKWTWRGAGWAFTALVLILLASSPLFEGKHQRYLPRFGTAGKMLGVGVLLVFLLALFQANVSVRGWKIREEVDSVRGPDNFTYSILRWDFIFTSREALARKDHNFWLGQRYHIVAARDFGFQDYHPRGIGIVLPRELGRLRNFNFEKWFIFVSKTDWVVFFGYFSSPWPNVCALAYNTKTKKGYSEYSDMPDDNRTNIRDLSPFILIGPDTPIHKPSAYVAEYVRVTNREDTGSDIAEVFPKPKVVREGLKHPNPEVRKMAQEILIGLDAEKKEGSFLQSITKLSETSGRNSVDILIDFLAASDSAVRVKAIRALGENKDRRAIKPLLLLLDDPEPSVRDTADDAIDHLTDASTMDILIAELKEAPPGVQLKIIEIFSKLGDKRAVEPLLRLLEDKNTTIKYDIFNALSRLKDPRAVGPLIQAMQSQNRAEKHAAANALVNLGGKEVVDGLIGALKTSDYYSCITAAEALGQIGDKRAVEPLIEALNHPMLGVRRYAAGALARIGDPQAIDPLKKLMKHPNPHVRKAAKKALDAIWKKTPATTQSSIGN